MKQIFLLFFFFFSFTFLFSQEKQNIQPNGYNQFYYDNGKLSSEGFMRDGKPDGYWKTYSEAGIIKSEGNRKLFELDSIWKFYDNEGKIAFEFNYEKGRKNGIKKTYDTKEGFLASTENYVNDIKEENTIYYYKSGKVKEVIPFKGGKENGMGYELSVDSIVITQTSYKMGFIQRILKINRKDKNDLKQGLWKEFFPNGEVKMEVTYTDNKMDGYLKEYAPNGSLLMTTKYINGVLQKNAPELASLELKKYYYESGAIKYTATYKDGVAEGIQREFSEQGKIIGAKVFAEGALVSEGVIDTAGRQQGVWKEYHPDGSIKSQGEYLNSMPVGNWVFNHANGKVEQLGKYDIKGRAQGVWKWFYESGNLLREENYRNGLRDGLMTEFDEDGKIITKGDFLDGLKEGFWILQLADYREEGNYIADRRSGEWKHFWISNGRLRYVGKYVDGYPDGMQYFYYDNGREKQTGKYAGGMKEGDWRFYDEAGFIFLTINFKNDIEIKFDGVKVLMETPNLEAKK